MNDSGLMLDVDMDVEESDPEEPQLGVEKSETEDGKSEAGASIHKKVCFIQ